MKLAIKNLTIQNKEWFNTFEYPNDLKYSYHNTNLLIIYWR